MQSTHALSSPSRFMKASRCRERASSDVTLSQFLKYLELLKEGESVLREAVERDEELASVPNQRHPSLTKITGGRRRSSCASDVGHFVNDTSDSCIHTGGTTSVFQEPFRLSVNSAYLRMDNISVHKDESDCIERRYRGCSPFTGGKSMSRYRARSASSSKEEPSEPENESSPDLEDIRTQLGSSSDLRRHSSTSSSVFSVSPFSRRQSLLNGMNKNKEFMTPSRQHAGLPVITFSPDESPCNRNCGANRRPSKVLQHGGTDPSRDSHRSKLYSDSVSGKVTRQSKLVSSSPSRHIESQRKSHLTNAKGSVIFKEIVLPCPHECSICYVDGLTRPMRLYYSHFGGGGGGRTAYLDGISDGNGNPGWPSSRKKEIKGLVYDRLSHSFHPPLPKKWMM